MKGLKLVHFVLLALILIFPVKDAMAGEKPLYVYYEIHLDNGIFPDKQVLDDVSADLRRIAGVFDKHGLKATFLVRPQYARAAILHKDKTLVELEGKGHEIGVHTHLYPNETDTVMDAISALRELGIKRIISANPGFRVVPQMPQKEKAIMAEKFKKGVEDMKAGGIMIYAGSFGSGDYLPYSPFRPAEGDYYPIFREGRGPRTDIKSSASGPLVALHSVPSGAYVWKEPSDEMRGGPTGRAKPNGRVAAPESQGNTPEAQRRKRGEIPSVREIGVHEMTESVRPKLERALRETSSRYSGGFNFFPIAIHEVEFMSTTLIDDRRVPVYDKDNTGFAALDTFLAYVIDPLVKDGKIRWTTMGGLCHEYAAFERSSRK